MLPLFCYVVLPDLVYFVIVYGFTKFGVYIVNFLDRHLKIPMSLLRTLRNNYQTKRLNKVHEI